ncbi:flagellar hook protein FlgE [Anaerobiospirillum succiniciproducens]|uniref:flagellar hook protein FlgE n=1 Tax=Anaerobiospirillum succiniciproducens TaxID=13335 RepID=UPI00235293C9|nr:flagellar hook protein FlgE [Anaerobiospirillum succiniciproducens]MCI6862751.1 flagellar hook protein FlgE [Anaerobiospirillum succiniciproducens]
MFGISVSGIKNSQKHIDVTSNNISNTNSYGFKKSRAEFADVYANSVFTNSKTNSGMGVQNTVVSQQFVQGPLSGDTGNPLDMAIQGNGFFVLEGPGSDAQTFTRNGAFQINKEGYVVTAMGDFLQGWDVNPDGTTTSLDLSNTHNIRLPADTGAPQMSTNISIGVNLPADKDNIKPNMPANDPWTNTAFDKKYTDNPQFGIPRAADGKIPANAADAKFTQYFTDFDPKNASTYTASTSQTIHDSLGRAHTLTYYMLKMGPETDKSNNNVWTVIPFVDGKPVDIATQGTGADKQFPTLISVPESSKSSVAGANYFGFKCTFLPNGEMKSTIPGKLELCNPDAANAATMSNSLREQLFGPPGVANQNGSLGANVFDLTFEDRTTQGQQKDSIYEGLDGSLHTSLGQGIDPVQKLNIQFAASQYGSSNFSVSKAPTNDGYATGILIGMSVDENGIIQCEYSNGQVKNIAKVAMADFANQQGLTKIGDTQWKQSNASGEAIAKEANSGSAGSIKGSNLELSNVDLTNELVELITAQRNYQANAQSLQTQNTVMDSILNIR